LSIRHRPPPTSTLFPYTTLFRSRIESRRQVSQRGTRDEATSRHGASVEGADTVFTLGQREALVYPQGMDPEIGADVALFRALSRSEEHTSELQSRENLVCRLLLE